MSVLDLKVTLSSVVTLIFGNIDAHISEIGTSGNLTVSWTVSIDGNSAVTITSGNITVAQGIRFG
jgi:hypothetical protein